MIFKNEGIINKTYTLKVFELYKENNIYDLVKKPHYF